MLKARIYRAEVADCINYAAHYTLDACVNARRAKAGDTYSARYVAAVKTQIRTCLAHAREYRLEAYARGFRLP